MIDIPHEVGQTERTLLIVEDDKSFLQRLARAMEARGFEVRTAESVGEGLQEVEKSAPADMLLLITSGHLQLVDKSFAGARPAKST